MTTRVRARLCERDAIGVDAIEQAYAAAEQNGRERNRGLVDQAGVQVLLDRLGSTGDTDIAVTCGLAGLAQRPLDSTSRSKPLPVSLGSANLVSECQASK